jgi:hypothetical protein
MKTLTPVVERMLASSAFVTRAADAEQQSFDLIVEIAAAEDRGDWPGAAQLRGRLYATRVNAIRALPA